MDVNKLVAAYPIMEVRNRTDTQKTITYANGETLTVQPLARVLISSNGLGQVPNSQHFELLNPTIFDLQAAGIVDKSSKADKKSAKGNSSNSGSSEPAHGSKSATHGHASASQSASTSSTSAPTSPTKAKDD